MICDWHYEPRESYPSVPMFLEKGFRVLPSSWKDAAASGAYIDYTLGLKQPNMLGHLFTSWSAPSALAAWPPLVQHGERLRPAAVKAGAAPKAAAGQ